MDYSAIFSYYLPTKLVHGFNAMTQAGKEAKRLGVKKALIVTDSGVKGAGLLNGGIKALETEGIPAVVFDEVEMDPGTKTVARGVDLLRSEGCNGVVVVGGGSPMAVPSRIMRGMKNTRPPLSR